MAFAADMCPADLSDETVVERVRGGDTAAFEMLMRRHNQLLYRAVRSVLRDEAETEDALQETYVRAFMHLDQFLGRARFATWMTRIAVNEAYHRRKRHARFTGIDEVADTLASPTPGSGTRRRRRLSCGASSKPRSIACRTTSAPSSSCATSRVSAPRKPRRAWTFPRKR